MQHACSAHVKVPLTLLRQADPPCDNWGLALQVSNTGAGAGDPGTMMIGVKLQGAERWRAWGAVALFTFLAILQNMGNFMPAYLYEQVCT